MENIKELAKETFSENQREIWSKSSEEDYKRVDSDLYFYDPLKELDIALGDMGDGWICLAEDFFQGQILDDQGNVYDEETEIEILGHLLNDKDEATISIYLVKETGELLKEDHNSSLFYLYPNWDEIFTGEDVSNFSSQSKIFEEKIMAKNIEQ